MVEIHVATHDLFQNPIHDFRLTVKALMVSVGHGEFGPVSAKKVFPVVRRELGVAVADDLEGEAVLEEDRGTQKVRELGSGDVRAERSREDFLRESVHENQDLRVLLGSCFG